MASPPVNLNPIVVQKLLEPYGRGPIPFAGTDNTFYERHLVFHNVVGLAPAVRGSGSRASPARCVTSSRNDGFTPRKHAGSEHCGPLGKLCASRSTW